MQFRRPTGLARELYANEESCFHVTLNAHPRFDRWPTAVADVIWQAVLEEEDLDRVHIYAVACLMPNHLHLLLSPRSSDLIQFVNAFKSWTTRNSWKTGTNGAVWQPSMWDRTIRSGTDFEQVCDYIVRNPIVAGFAEEEGEWRYTWAWWFGDA